MTLCCLLSDPKKMHTEFTLLFFSHSRKLNNFLNVAMFLLKMRLFFLVGHYIQFIYFYIHCYTVCYCVANITIEFSHLMQRQIRKLFFIFFYDPFFSLREHSLTSVYFSRKGGKNQSKIFLGCIIWFWALIRNEYTYLKKKKL